MFLPEEHLAGAALAAADPFADDLPSLFPDLRRGPARSGPHTVCVGGLLQTDQTYDTLQQQAEAQPKTDSLWFSCASQTREAALGNVDVRVDNQPGGLQARAAPLLSQASMASMASTIPDFEYRASDGFDGVLGCDNVSDFERCASGHGNVSGDESVVPVARNVYGDEVDAGQTCAGSRNARTKRRALGNGGGDHTVDVSDEVACRAAYMVSRFVQLVPTLDNGTTPSVESLLSSIAAHELPRTSGNARSVPGQGDTSCNTPQQLTATQLRLRSLELEVYTIHQQLEHGSVCAMVPSKRARVSP